MTDYIYQDYLDVWTDRFGDVQSALYWYWKHGKKIEKPIHRLTEPLDGTKPCPGGDNLPFVA